MTREDENGNKNISLYKSLWEEKIGNLTGNPAWGMILIVFTSYVMLLDYGGTIMWCLIRNILYHSHW